MRDKDFGRMEWNGMEIECDDKITVLFVIFFITIPETTQGAKDET